MKISYYDLLGLIKENKQPEKVKYDGKIYTYDYNEYLDDKNNDLTTKIRLNLTEYGLVVEENIEIIEDKPKIEKLTITKNGLDKPIITDNHGSNYKLGGQTRLFVEKLNEVIDVLNEMRDKDVD